jgi:hypothetical protein
MGIVDLFQLGDGLSQQDRRSAAARQRSGAGRTPDTVTGTGDQDLARAGAFSAWGVVIQGSDR